MLPESIHDFEFLLFEGFSNIALSCAMEPLRDVKLRAGRKRANWIVTTLDGERATSSSGLQIVPNSTFQADRPSKRLVLVAGYGVRNITNPDLRAKLRIAARQCEAVVAIDAAAWLLADAGLLDGHVATIHWQDLKEFAEAFPAVATTSDHFVKSGKYYTCGGASTVLELMFDMLSSLFGPATAFDASNMFVYSDKRAPGATKSAPNLSVRGSPMLVKAVELIAEDIQFPMSTSEIAKHIGVSSRTLHRTFLSELHVTPGKFRSRFRLKQAEYLAASTDLSLEQIALRCGYASASSLCRAYKGVFEETLIRKVSQMV